MKNNTFWKYILSEKKYLLFVTITGLIYNIGLTATPYFEGQLAGRLADIYGGLKKPSSMITLAVFYLITILVVQISRYFKRYYVRKFGNDINKNLKMDIYHNFVYSSSSEDAGSIMTKAILDVDACSEGIRKFTTEIFDTGIALISYVIMLMIYDLKLTIIVMMFQILSYFIASKLGPVVASRASKSKKSADKLNASTLDRLHLAITYRIYGQESNMHALYENALKDYEEKTIQSNILETTLRPIYQVIAMLGVLFIICYGSNNVINNIWTIAIFTTYISCFAKTAKKAGSAAKLFNAVQKAKVSWNRIYPYLINKHVEKDRKLLDIQSLKVSNLEFSYDNKKIFSNVSFEAHPGEIIGITGEIACGKSTLGKMFLRNSHYLGSIKINNLELRDIDSKYSITSYLGHSLQLFDDTIENNIELGIKGNIIPVLDTVCMHDEVNSFENGIYTRLGEGGIRLSGGQQSRIALARTLYHKRGILVLDDPFSACDKDTEREIYNHLRNEYKDCIILLISHRLSLFKDLDQVLFMNNNEVEVSTHKKLMQSNQKYKDLYTLQTKEAL